MITTFKYIFEGRRELFKGLKIDEYDDPVARALANPAEAEQVRAELKRWYNGYRFSPKKAGTAAEALKYVPEKDL